MCKLRIMLDQIDALLAPLARLLVRLGVAFPEFTERMKGHLVRAAEDAADGKPTDSRLSVMTGLQRRDIARLRNFEAKPPKPVPLAKLVALWRSDPAFADQGSPRALPRTGPVTSFEALARAVRQDIHPRAMLDTLAQAGAVRIDEKDHIHLLTKAWLPTPGSADQLSYLARNVGDHLATATDNLTAETPVFERAMQVSGLSQKQVDALLRDFEADQMALLQSHFQRAQDMKASGGGGTLRLRAGAYLRATETKEDPQK